MESTGAPAHDDPVRQSNIGFRIQLDAAIELIFLAPKGQLIRVAPGPAKFIHFPDVAARAKSFIATAPDNDPADRCIPLPFVEHGGHFPYHVQGQGVERLGTVEGDDATRTCRLAYDFRLAHDPTNANIAPMYMFSIYFVQAGSFRSSRLDISPARTKSP